MRSSLAHLRASSLVIDWRRRHRGGEVAGARRRGDTAVHYGWRQAPEDLWSTWLRVLDGRNHRLEWLRGCFSTRDGFGERHRTDRRLTSPWAWVGHWPHFRLLRGVTGDLNATTPASRRGR